MDRLVKVHKILHEDYYGSECFEGIEDLIMMYIWKHNDPYLKYSASGSFLDIFDILGMQVAFLSKEAVKIERFLDDRTRKLRAGDVVIQINQAKPLEYEINVNERIQVLAIRGLYTNHPELIE